MSETGPATQAEADQEPVVVKRTYSAELSELWALWTTKVGFESQWRLEGFRVAVHPLEAREGGALVYDMIADTPETIAAMERMGQPVSHATRGRFAEFQLPARLRLVHAIDCIAGLDPCGSTIEVEFFTLGDRTRMVVTLHPHPDPLWTRMLAEGFRSQLTKLDQRFG